MTTLSAASHPTDFLLDTRRRFSKRRLCSPGKSNPTDRPSLARGRECVVPTHQSIPTLTDFELCVSLIEVQQTHNRLSDELDLLREREERGRTFRDQDGSTPRLAEEYALFLRVKIERTQRKLKEIRSQAVRLVKTAEDRLNTKRKPSRKAAHRFHLDELPKIEPRAERSRHARSTPEQSATPAARGPSFLSGKGVLQRPAGSDRNRLSGSLK